MLLIRFAINSSTAQQSNVQDLLSSLQCIGFVIDECSAVADWLDNVSLAELVRVTSAVSVSYCESFWNEETTIRVIFVLRRNHGKSLIEIALSGNWLTGFFRGLSRVVLGCTQRRLLSACLLSLLSNLPQNSAEVIVQKH